MAKISSLRMGDTVCNDPRVNLIKGFLGLTTKAAYNTTGSLIDCKRIGLSPADGDRMKRIIEAKDNLEKLIGDFKPQDNPNGNYQLEYCKSRDNQFVALQLSHYFQLEYAPISEVLFYEGEQARQLCKML